MVLVSREEKCIPIMEYRHHRWNLCHEKDLQGNIQPILQPDEPFALWKESGFYSLNRYHGDHWFKIYPGLKVTGVGYYLAGFEVRGHW